MASLLLIIIYIVFINLGLPDALLGAGWPAMHKDLGVSLSSIGILSMLFYGGTILSSFSTGKLLHKYGTGKVTLFSVFLTGISIFGFYFVPSYLWICVMIIPLSLGAGAVDAAMNNFVALHYKASHMNWLHCFWGVGATLGPMILAPFIGSGHWRTGFLTIGLIQFAVVVILILTLALWKKYENSNTDEKSSGGYIKTSQIFSKPGVKLSLTAFLIYCALEASAGLWGSSYLVNIKGISDESAARIVSLFYLGITIGRFISGFITVRLENRKLIRLGQILVLVGIVIMLIPLPIIFTMAGLVLIGLGCAPIYPGLMHETPKRFGNELSQTVMGAQVAFAYIGSTFVPPLLGYIAKGFSISIYPGFLLIMAVIMIFISEMMNSNSKKKVMN